MQHNGELAVFYDGSCPLCSREISYYKSRRGADSITWIDLGDKRDDDDVAPGLTKHQALARFHVMRKDGTLVSGGAAFAELWRNLRSFQRIGRILQLPVMSSLLEYAYRLFLKVRPWMQRLLWSKSSASAK